MNHVKELTSSCLEKFSQQFANNFPTSFQTPSKLSLTIARCAAKFVRINHLIKFLQILWRYKKRENRNLIVMLPVTVITLFSKRY